MRGEKRNACVDNGTIVFRLSINAPRRVLLPRFRPSLSPGRAQGARGREPAPNVARRCELRIVVSQGLRGRIRAWLGFPDHLGLPRHGRRHWFDPRSAHKTEALGGPARRSSAKGFCCLRESTRLACRYIRDHGRTLHAVAQAWPTASKSVDSVLVSGSRCVTWDSSRRPARSRPSI